MADGWDVLIDQIIDQRGQLKQYEKLLKDKNSTYDKKQVSNYLQQVNTHYDVAIEELESLEKKL
jgi:hypothetical protein